MIPELRRRPRRVLVDRPVAVPESCCQPGARCVLCWSDPQRTPPGRANWDLVWFGWGSRRLAAGGVGSGRGLTADRSLGVATGPDPAPARPGAARLVTESLRRRVRHTSSAGRWLGRLARPLLAVPY